MTFNKSTNIMILNIMDLIVTLTKNDIKQNSTHNNNLLDGVMQNAVMLNVVAPKAHQRGKKLKCP
jgi:hypothetical protein